MSRRTPPRIGRLGIRSTQAGTRLIILANAIAVHAHEIGDHR
ncbi:hypothetical protein FHR81_003778 [Actinoalloteichus hoggarensis]|nr:hypothetical protein [Actinoalloteichus hoggarensis]MBB5922721.1 hypothetical protein [Actinoalloteichus hoggarensis]